MLPLQERRPIYLPPRHLARPGADTMYVSMFLTVCMSSICC